MKALRRCQTSSSEKSSPQSSSPNSPSLQWIHLRSVLFLVASSLPANCSSSSPSNRDHLRSPWPRKKRKHILSFQQWRAFFTPEGKLHDSGTKLLKKVRSGGIDLGIRAEVWPFLLGVYDLTSSKEERDVIRTRKREEYENLRRICRRLLKHNSEDFNLNGTGETSNGDGGSPTDFMYSLSSEDVVTARESLSSEETFPFNEEELIAGTKVNGYASSKRTTYSNISDSESLDSNSSDDLEVSQAFNFMEIEEENTDGIPSKEDLSPYNVEFQSKPRISENCHVAANNPP